MYLAKAYVSHVSYKKKVFQDALFNAIIRDKGQDIFAFHQRLEVRPVDRRPSRCVALGGFDSISVHLIDKFFVVLENATPLAIYAL